MINCQKKKKKKGKPPLPYLIDHLNFDSQHDISTNHRSTSNIKSIVEKNLYFFGDFFSFNLSSISNLIELTIKRSDVRPFSRSFQFFIKNSSQRLSKVLLGKKTYFFHFFRIFVNDLKNNRTRVFSIFEKRDIQ